MSEFLRFDASSGEQAAVRAECLGCLFLPDFSQCTRASGYYMGLSTCTDLSIVRRTSRVPFLMKIVQLYQFDATRTPPLIFCDPLRSTAIHSVASTPTTLAHFSLVPQRRCSFSALAPCCTHVLPHRSNALRCDTYRYRGACPSMQGHTAKRFGSRTNSQWVAHLRVFPNRVTLMQHV